MRSSRRACFHTIRKLQYKQVYGQYERDGVDSSIEHAGYEYQTSEQCLDAPEEQVVAMQ